jgi:hypothetical protein
MWLELVVKYKVRLGSRNLEVLRKNTKNISKNIPFPSGVLTREPSLQDYRPKLSGCLQILRSGLCLSVFGIPCIYCRHIVLPSILYSEGTVFESQPRQRHTLHRLLYHFVFLLWESLYSATKEAACICVIHVYKSIHIPCSSVSDQ